MTYYLHYDPQTGEVLGFYSRAIHGADIPEPCIEISREEWSEALAGGRIVQDGVLVEGTPPPVFPSAAAQVQALTAQYQPRFRELREARVATQAAGYGDEAVAEIDAEYRALMEEFNAKMEAIG